MASTATRTRSPRVARQSAGSREIARVVEPVRQGYRSTKRMIRRHPAASSAIVIVGASLAAGIVAGLYLRSRSAARKPMVATQEVLSDLLAKLRG